MNRQQRRAEERRRQRHNAIYEDHIKHNTARSPPLSCSERGLKF
jgi:hypothetical protein